MKDKNGAVLAVGDLVNIPAVVKSLDGDFGGHCNATVETVEPLIQSPQYKPTLALNTAQMVKVAAMLVLLAILFSAFSQAKAQTLPATPPTTDQVRSNLLGVTGASAVATFALNLLPGWDRTATNYFQARELELETGPVWKSATTSGATPFISVGGNYFFTRSIGIGGDAITFGNGTGQSDLDSAHAFGILRADKGNVAGHILLGGGRDVSLGRYLAEIGGGFEYRYSTGVGLLVDTRYVYRFESGKLRDGDHEFLTRVALTLHF